MDLICYSFLSLPYCPVCSLEPCGHLLEKGLPLGSLAWAVFLCFCHFPIWYPVSDVVLDCNDSLSLPSSYLANICLSCSRVINQFSTRIVYLIAPNQQSVHFDYF